MTTASWAPGCTQEAGEAGGTLQDPSSVGEDFVIDDGFCTLDNSFRLGVGGQNGSNKML